MARVARLTVRLYCRWMKKGVETRDAVSLGTSDDDLDMEIERGLKP